MADTITVNYGWVKPQIAGSATTWGAKLNTDLDEIDAVVYGISGQAGVSTINGTGATAFAGTLVPQSANLLLNKAGAGQQDQIIAVNNGLMRWLLVLGDAAAETGSNAGSNLQLQSFTDAGTPLGTPLSILRATGAATFSAGLVGTTTNDNASAGMIGEAIASNVAAASAIALTTGVPVNVTLIALTAGDWDVSGEVWFAGSGDANALLCAINSASATLPGDSAIGAAQHGLSVVFETGGTNTLPLRTCRVSLASPTTYYLVAFANFSGAYSAFGNIIARRAR